MMSEQRERREDRQQAWGIDEEQYRQARALRRSIERSPHRVACRFTEGQGWV